ncbi:MAG: hypothetical protein OH363_05795 [Candidatus Parvarchaeota archaeon]|nr:hypothetical protein [Candidatus Jingweiarchaeum tengchongense]
MEIFPKLKQLKNNKGLWEYRDKSTRVKKLIRIYFGVDEGNKEIIVIDANYKQDDKHQSKELNNICQEKWFSLIMYKLN